MSEQAKSTAESRNGPETRPHSYPGELGIGLTGRRLGHFRLGEKLGGGVVAAVYRAIDERTDTPVAIKLLLAGADEVMHERFRREAELVSTLHHPHIVDTLEVGELPITTPLAGETESIAYIAMELIEGYSLAQLLERHGRLSATDATAILAPIADALGYAHAADIVHRDVKPSNILLRREEGNPPGSVRLSPLEYAVTPLLTDFGIARAIDAPELTNAGRTIGTPAFMSPEQCAGADELDGRADVYGLGAVLYRSIVGKTPYSGSATQMLYAHVYEPLLIPDEMVDLLPPIALNTLQRSMMKDPGHRYQTAGDMAHDLSLASGRQPTAGGDPGNAGTVTMPALPVVNWAGQNNPARVLVPISAPPAASPPASTPVPAKELNRPTVRLEPTPPRTVEREPERAHRRIIRNLPRGRRLRKAWGAPVAISLAALLLVAVGISAFALIFWPQSRDFLAGLQSNGGDEIGVVVLPTETGESAAVVGPTATPTAQEIADQTSASAQATARPTATTTAAPPPATGPPDTSTPMPGATDPVASDPGASDPVDTEPDAAEPDAAETGTDETDTDAPDGDEPAEDLTPQARARLWDEAQEAFDAGEWEIAAELLARIRANDATWQSTQVAQMLGTLYLELAEANFEAGDIVEALEFLLRAAQEEVEPSLADDFEVALLAWEAEPEANGLVDELQVAIAEVADAIAQDERPCTAVAYGTIAVALGQTQESAWLDGLVEDCEDSRTPQIPAPSGRLIYSTQEGDAYRIHATALSSPGSSTLLVDDAAQPRLSPDTSTLAFHSRQRALTGLAGLNLLSAQNPGSRDVQFTANLEDSRDSPPSWSPSGERLAFSSTRFGDGRHRIYITSADANHAAQELRLGRDPAWHPWQELVVFNGVDENGQNPGLWSMRPDGSELRQLTDNGNDLRPTWSPNGSFIVFMSNGRDGNWELYRLNVETLAIARLTFSDAQDGLPTVSPDGNYVAFASDRAGFWEFWYVSIWGGESVRIGSMNGQLVSWLEHGIHWVP